MYQIDNSTAASTQPAATAPGTPGFFTDGSLGGGTPATIVPAEWLNAVQQELINIVEGAGITPTKAAYNQVGQALQSGKLNYAQDTGAANAYAVAYAPPITTLVDGMILRFQAITANTGASTLNVNGIGQKPIIGGAHSALQGGEIAASGKVEVMWHAGLASFVLLGQTGGSFQVPPATKSNQAINLSQFQRIGSGPNGIRLPDGTILMFGTVAISGTNTSTVVTLPTTFPNACLWVVTSDTGNTTWPSGGAPASNSTITVYVSPFSINTGSAVAKNSIAVISWLAIGY